MSLIKALVNTINWKNTAVFFLFLVLAFIFWMMLFFQRDIEATYKIPLKYTNIQEDEVFDNPLPQNVEVRLEDKGSRIFRYDFFLKDSIEIDVAKYKNDLINNIQGTQLSQLIRSKLAQSTNLRAYYPANISIVTSKLQKKEITAVFDGEISTRRNNLVVDSIVLLPKTIVAIGSDKQLKKIGNKVKTEYSVFNNLKATSQFKVNLKKVDGVKFKPNEIEVYVPISEFTERNIEVPILTKNMPNNLDVKFFPSQAEITFLVTLDQYKKINPEDFEIKLNYRKFHKNENGKVDLEVTKAPPSVQNVKINPSSVEFLFESK